MAVEPVDNPKSPATGWPTSEDLRLFLHLPVGAEPENLDSAIEAAVDLGATFLSSRYVGPIDSNIFRAALDYAGSIYTERVGQSDVPTESFYGSTSLARFRRALAAARFTSIA